MDRKYRETTESLQFKLNMFQKKLTWGALDKCDVVHARNPKLTSEQPHEAIMWVRAGVASKAALGDVKAWYNL